MIFEGDHIYFIDCTGDAVIGDEVKFSRAIFSGPHTNPKLEGYEIISGQIISESYGQKKQQHTFTLLLADGRKTRIKGRNLYRHGVWRRKWEDEKERSKALAEKHERGSSARRLRNERRIYEGI